MKLKQKQISRCEILQAFFLCNEAETIDLIKIREEDGVVTGLFVYFFILSPL